MYRKILIRVLLFYPTLFVLSVFLFMLKESATGDEVISLCGGDIVFEDRLYQECIEAYDLNKPSFYFSLGPSFVDHKALAAVFPEGRRNTVEHLLYNSGDWQLVKGFDSEMIKLFAAFNEFDADNAIELKSLKNRYFRGLDSKELAVVIEDLSALFPDERLGPVRSIFGSILNEKPKLLEYLPSLELHGFDNRFHKWWRSAIVFDFGQSFRGRSVNSLIKGSVKYTLLLNLLAFFISVVASIGLVFFVNRKSEQTGNRFDGAISMLMAVPRFWLATLLIFFFANKILFPELSLFRIGALEKGASVQDIFQYLTLPIFCLAFPITLSIYKHLRENIAKEYSKQYVQAARARGIKEKQIFSLYVLPNALNPLFTLVGTLFSRLLVGSVIIESIFFIPGLGGLLFDAFMSNDWPVLYALCFISGIMTLIGYLISDLLYVVFDPKLRLGGLGYEE